MIQVSPSRVLCYQNCGRQFYFKYVRKLPSKGGDNLVFGKAFHRAGESMLRVLDANPSISDEACSAIGIDVFSSDLVLENAGLKDTGIALCRQFPQAWKRQGLMLARFVQAGVDRPALEVRGSWQISSDIVVTGFSDIICVDKTDDLVVLDLKTPRSESAAGFLEKSLQLSMYSGMFGASKAGFWEALKRAIPKTARGEGPVFRDAKIFSVSEEIREDHRQAIVDVVQDIYDGRFHRESKMAHNTPCGMCDYSDICASTCLSRDDARSQSRDAFFRSATHNVTEDSSTDEDYSDAA